MAETRHEIVTLEVFKDTTALTVPSELEGFLAQRLKQYQVEAEVALNRPCWVEVTDEVVTDISGGMLVTRRRPVVSVEEIMPDQDHHITSGGLIHLGTAPFTYTTTELTISYTSRLPYEREETVKSIVYARAERALVRAIDEGQGVRSVNEGGYSASYIAEDWTPEEAKTLVSMRKRSSR